MIGVLYCDKTRRQDNIIMLEGGRGGGVDQYDMKGFIIFQADNLMWSEIERSID